MNILLVDDHPVLRDGLSTLLAHALVGTTVIQAESVATAVARIVAQPDLDLVILDYLMPVVGGRAAITEVGRARPDLPIIVYSSSENPDDARHALAAGALGYVPKSATPNVLLTAINMVLAGEVYVPPLVLHPAPASAGVKPDTPVDLRSLTARQIDVLNLISQGYPNKIIAAQLALSEKTVKAHITAIFKALNVVNRTQAARIGRSTGLI